MRERKDAIFFKSEVLDPVCPWLHSRVSFSGIVSWCYLWLSSLLGGFIWLNIDCSSQPASAITSISASAVSYTPSVHGDRPRELCSWGGTMWILIQINWTETRSRLFFLSLSKISRFIWKYHIYTKIVFSKYNFSNI